MMQQNDRGGWALSQSPQPPPLAQANVGPTSLQAVLATLPPQAQSSAAIVAEVSRILAESPYPNRELTALQQRAWHSLTLVDARQDNRQVHVSYSFTNCFNDQRDYSDHSRHETHQPREINWRAGIAAAFVAFILIEVLRGRAYVDGLQRGYEAGEQWRVQP